MDNKMLAAYFVIGGIVVSAVTYFGSHSKSMLAAFIAIVPCVSVITLCTIYFNSGTEATVSYAKNMLILLPPWVLYVLGIVFLLPRIGLAGSLVASIGAFLVTALLIMKFTSNI
jgi:uncharacterized membrane protein (GlpM family)